MDKDSIVKKLRSMKVQFVTENIGTNPAKLPQFLAEFVGYHAILAEHHANLVREYGVLKSKVLEEEYARRDEINATVEKASERISATETEARISRRLGEIVKERDAMEILWKTNTQFINVMQSLRNAWSDEAKGIM